MLEPKNIDYEILARSKEEIINFIFESYGEGIKRLIFTYVKNQTQTDDIFQEFLIKAYKSLDSFNSNSTLKTWLYRIAINKCKDYLRSPIHRLIQYNEHMKTSKRQKSVEQISIEKERKEEIVEAILQLPIKYREVIILKFYRNLTIKEISELLSINESTVKTRIMRGKKKIKSKIGGYDVE